MVKKKFKIIIEESGRAKPRPHELRVARIAAEYFQSDVIFLRRYSSRTPDLYVIRTNVRWEIKSPTGSSKYTIQNNLGETEGQSDKILLDLYRIKLTDMQGISRTRDFFRKERSRIRKLKIITKDGKVVDILDKK